MDSNDSNNSKNDNNRTFWKEVLITYTKALMSIPESYIFINNLINLPNHYFNSGTYDSKLIIPEVLYYNSDFNNNNCNNNNSGGGNNENQENSDVEIDDIDEGDNNEPIITLTRNIKSAGLKFPIDQIENNSDNSNNNNNNSSDNNSNNQQQNNIISNQNEIDDILKVKIKYSLKNLINKVENNIFYSRLQDFIDNLFFIFNISNVKIINSGDNGNENSNGSVISRIINTLTNKITNDQTILKQVIASCNSKKRKSLTNRIFKIIEYKDKQQQPNKKSKIREEKIIEKPLKDIKKEEKFKQVRNIYDQLSVDEKKMFKFDYILDNIKPPPRTEEYSINQLPPYALFDPIYLNPKKKLYNYQKLSLQKMIDREVNNKEFLDPRWVIIEDNNNNVNNINSNNCSIYNVNDNNNNNDNGDNKGKLMLIENLITKERKRVLELPKLKDCKGGILAEEMGTGKTIICLALILSTLGSYSKPDTSTNNNWIVQYPSFFKSSNNTTREIKPLSYLAMRAIRMLGVPSIAYPISEVIKEDIGRIPSTKITIIKESHNYNSRSSSESVKTRNLICSSTTLIIAPNQILQQWGFEILYHSKIKYLLIENKDKLPPASELIKYDVILLTHTKISNSKILSNIKHHEDQQQQGHEDEFNDNLEDDINPLLQIYWLRIIIDEGHTIGSVNSNLTEFSKIILSERRWIVSGTPLSGSLLNQELNNLKSLLCFLQVEPYSDSLSSNYSKLITQPINKFKIEGINRVLDIMNRIAIRTPLKTIENDIVLPKLTITVKRLSMNSNQVLLYNELVCIILTNLLTSQFEGPDSLYSGKNQQFAMIAIKNLRKSCFISEFQSEENRNNAKDSIEAALLKTIIPLKDKYSLLSIYNYFNYISNVYSSYLNKFKLLINDNNNSNNNNDGISNNNSDSNKSKKKVQFNLDEETERELNQYSNINNSNNKSDNNKLDNNKSDNNDIKLNYLTSIIKDNDTIKKIKKNENANDSNGVIQEEFKSCKLEYLISRLEELDRQEPPIKTIVFTQFNETFYEIEWSLKFKTNLKYLVYNTHQSLRERASTINSFQTNDNYKIIIMNAELASYGINLTAASHIIMVEASIWSISKERQMVKRAHRIGQTKPVTVEKLLINDSIEQILLNLNSDNNSNNTNNGKQDNNNSDNNNNIKEEFLFMEDKKEENSKRIKSILKSLKLIPDSNFKMVTEIEFNNFIQKLIQTKSNQ